MTSAETKQELTEEFSGIKYILTSKMRSKLLLSLYKHPKKLEELRNELKKPSATILHGLKELETINLVKKFQKTHQIIVVLELFAVGDEGGFAARRSHWKSGATPARGDGSTP